MAAIILVALNGDSNKMMQEIEIQRLREQVAQMQEEIEAIRKDIYDAAPNEEGEPDQEADDGDNEKAIIVAKSPPQPADTAPWYAPRRMGSAMNWMFDMVQAHTIIKGFGWAMVDGAKLAGFLGAATFNAGKMAKNNPKATGAVLGAAAAIAAVEYATRYEDEEGKTHHKCSIM
jgi:hypothetical protein